MQTPVQPIAPAFAKLVAGCAAHGIGRTTSFELARDGLMQTFKIGKSRYVMLESLRTLPERLAALEAEQRKLASKKVA